MTDHLANALNGLTRQCPRCDAQPGDPCVNRFGAARITTHLERKDRGD